MIIRQLADPLVSERALEYSADLSHHQIVSAFLASAHPRGDERCAAAPENSITRLVLLFRDWNRIALLFIFRQHATFKPHQALQLLPHCHRIGIQTVADEVNR